MKEEKKPDKPKTKKQSNQFIQYSGMAFQMLASIILGVFIGKQIDNWLGMEKPIFTMIFSLVFVFAGIWIAVKDLIK